MWFQGRYFVLGQCDVGGVVACFFLNYFDCIIDDYDSLTFNSSFLRGTPKISIAISAVFSSGLCTSQTLGSTCSALHAKLAMRTGGNGFRCRRTNGGLK